MIALLCSGSDDVADLIVNIHAAAPACQIRMVRSIDELDEALSDPALELLISDVVNGWIHGLEVISRAFGMGVVGKVIMASNVGDEELAADVIKAGALDYVVRRPSSRRLGRAISVGLGLQKRLTTSEHLAAAMHDEYVNRGQPRQ